MHGRGRNPGGRLLQMLDSSRLTWRARLGMVLILVSALAITGGCGRFHTEKGIEPAWHDQEAGSFRTGVSTQTDVMALLGPPSQIISHRDGSIFYYLHEEAVGVGYIFILFNYAKLNTRYDRAIFFFDAGGILQDYALSAPPRPAQ